MSKLFAIGDTVRLKSGGPKMTVTSTDALTVQVSWFVSDVDTRQSFLKMEAIIANGVMVPCVHPTGNWSGPHREAYPVDALEPA